MTGTMSKDTTIDIIMSKLSEEEILIYRTHFDSFDLNGDGVISAKELEKVSRKLGYRMSPQEIQDIMLATDLDSNGYLSFEEFLLAMPGNTKIPRGEHKAAEICRKFMEYDRDSNGQITVSEAHRVLSRELAFELDETSDLLKRYDRNKDGQLNYEEFIDFYRNIRNKAEQIHELFQIFDRDQSGAVSVSEAKYVLAKLDIADREVEGLVAIHDKNKDGELQYDEFVAFLLRS